MTWLSTLVLEVASMISFLFLTKVIDPSHIHPVINGDLFFFHKWQNLLPVHTSKILAACKPVGTGGLLKFDL